MTGGLVFLGAVGLTVGAYEAMKLPEEKKGFDWTQVEFPGMSRLGLGRAGGDVLLVICWRGPGSSPNQ